MGSAVGVAAEAGADSPTIACSLRNLPAAIEESVYVQERFPVIIDPSGQAMRFLKYQLGSFCRSDDLVEFTAERLNAALAGAIQHGRTMTLHFQKLTGVSSDIFRPGLFPSEVISKVELYRDGVWQSVFNKKNLGGADVNELTPSPDFVFIVCTEDPFVPILLSRAMTVIRIDQGSAGAGAEAGEAADGMEAIADMYGAKETVRNSIPLTEAAFDGDVEELQSWIAKGFHIESVDGRKHTALSEASCQGHAHVVRFLLEAGADPNTRSDTGRSALWRAAFNGHQEVLQLLLEAGADPDHADLTSMENVFDVAKTDEIRQILTEWDPSYTAVLKERRRLAILAAVESRIRTQAERDERAKQLLREELVNLAGKGDVAALRDLLLMMADEADQTNTRPRATADARNSQGQSLLSIAVQRDDEKMVEFLLTQWKTCDKDRWDLADGEISTQAKVFKTNPNARDLKGWSPACIAVFHNSRKSLRLLLEHGADPYLKSSYNKNAWDLAKDELDAAMNIVKSNAEIRQILKEFEEEKTSKLFGNGSVSLAVVGNKSCSTEYSDVGKDGSAMLMNIEMNKETMHLTEEINDKSAVKSGKKKKSSASKNAKKK